MSDPYYDIDIPHLEASLAAANKRRRHTPKGGFDDPDRIGWFFFHLADSCREEGDKARLRRAIGICFDLLDGHSCPRVHCEKWGSSRARNCSAGKNPKTCPICKKYLANKAERKSAKQAAPDTGAKAYDEDTVEDDLSEIEDIAASLGGSA